MRRSIRGIEWRSPSRRKEEHRGIFLQAAHFPRDKIPTYRWKSLESRPHSPPRQTSIPCVCRTVPDQAVFEPIRLPAEKTPVVFPSREKEKKEKKISLDLPFLSPFLPSGRGKMFHPRRDFFPFGENRFSLSLFFPSPSLPLSLHLHRFVSILQTMAQLSLPSPRFFRLWFCFSELSSRKNF